MNTPVWAKVGVDIQSVLGTSLTVSAISKANPAVLTYGAGDADPANGDYFLIEASGMTQINNMVVRVANVNAVANTFECEGLDSTSFDTLNSATAKPITFGKSFSTLLDFTMSGGEVKYTDDTDIHDEMDVEIPVGFTALKATSNSRFLPTDTALLECQSASRAKLPRAILIKFSNGAKVAGYASVGAPLVPTGSKGGTVQTPLSFSFKGFPSAWAS